MKQRRFDRSAPAALLVAAMLTFPAALTAIADDSVGKCRLEMDLAAGYHHFFAPFSGPDTMAALQMMPVDAFLAALKSGDPLLVLDVRTPGETGILGITLPGSLAISMDQVFTPENLRRLDDGHRVVVVCQAGHRATAVALALRHVGLEDVWILMGGLAALADQLTPKTAY